MALNIQFQLSNGRGLGKAIVFHGLKFNVVVHPTIHGQPILTSQAFYYLDQLDSIAEIRFETDKEALRDSEVEYLIDNYLFKYSKLHADSFMTSKVTDPKYWRDDYSDMYAEYDHRNTNALVLDKGNDESVLAIRPLDESDDTDLSDWCLVRNYSDIIISQYVSSMSELVHKKMHIEVMPTLERDGYVGKKRILECDAGLLSYYQAQSLDHSFSPRDVQPGQNSIVLKAYSENIADVDIPVETVHLDKVFNPILLSYYFSGLKAVNSLISFVGFYNVLEYYFEEAPIILNVAASNEKKQLKCVIEWLVNDNDISDFFQKNGADFVSQTRKNIETSSTIDIEGFDVGNSANLVTGLAKWLYSIRCAIVHSKKTRSGQDTATFEPYSDEAENIHDAILVVRWLSVACIEKDCEIGRE